MTQQDLTDLLELGIAGAVIALLLAPLWLPVLLWRALTRDD